MQSALYFGHLSHRRFVPWSHAFTARGFWLYLDLAEAPRVFAGRWFWGINQARWATFLRRDHFGDPAVPLEESVAELVSTRTGEPPRGPVRLLTFLRMGGYYFNPLTVYYCFDAADQRVETIVAEVSNTPWLERHCYVLRPGESSNIDNTAGQANHFSSQWAKEFHVSPFMPMDHEYRWHSTLPGDQLAIQLENWRGTARQFSACLTLRRTEISGRALAYALCRYPLQPLAATAGIYWQALCLWWKGARYYPHPGATLDSAPTSPASPPLVNSA
ncbi:MAG: DUF1365 domain-containing protein [Pirellulales bacterium]|nr:DUF1365 domain-containing protein [Pirellulales bacterium]